ncbi:MAG: hypothetical protein GY811_15735, partial [Myxococcales bacterium]|nr:hypothetical protein [Myxococcales bacterium]
MIQKKSKPSWFPAADGRLTEDLAREMLLSWKSSGLSILGFARLHEITAQRV